MNEKTFERGDSPRSLIAVIQLGKQALASIMERIDTKWADACNGEE